MSDEQTALTVIPKNELAVVAQQAGAKADKFAKTANRIGFGSLGGFAVASIGALVALHLAPVAAPVLAITAFASALGGPLTAGILQSKGDKARRRQAEAIRLQAEAARKRGDLLAETAFVALEGAIEDGTIRIGLDLRIEPQGETPKKVHVEDVSATIRGKSEKKLCIAARLFEEDGTRIDWLGISASAVSLERSVAAFPKSVLESIRNEFPLAESPMEPPPASGPEKKLPPYTPGLGG